MVHGTSCHLVRRDEGAVLAKIRQVYIVQKVIASHVRQYYGNGATGNVSVVLILISNSQVLIKIRTAFSITFSVSFSFLAVQSSSHVVYRRVLLTVTPGKFLQVLWGPRCPSCGAGGLF